LWAELIAIFVVLPSIFVVYFYPRLIFTALWPLTILTLVYLIRRRQIPFERLWKQEAVTWTNLKPVLMRFTACAIFMSVFTYFVYPEVLFGFVSAKPSIWALVMFLYPVLSALPQEILFRSFFFERYRPLLGSGTTMLLTNGILFGYAHIFLQNWVAVTFCIVGGLLFAQTYEKTRSLALVTLEHALYGCFIFTIGLGRFFYGGTVVAN